MMPILILQKGEIGYTLLATIVVVLLYLFESDFKYLKSNLPGFKVFFKISFASGLSLASLGLIFPTYSVEMIVVWMIATFVYGFVLADKIDEGQC